MKPAGLRRAIVGALAGLLGIVGIPLPGTASPAPETTPGHPVIRSRDHDHDEQPHTPEQEPTEIPAEETEIVEQHVLVVDDPRYGVLNGRNYIGFCDDCPVSKMGGAQCGGIAGGCPGSQAGYRWASPR